jgi:hypothetical protein
MAEILRREEESIAEPVIQNAEIEAPVSKSEIGQFTKEYSPWARKQLAEEITAARMSFKLREGDSEKTGENIKELQANFYKRFSKQKERFEQEADKRDIASIGKEYGVFFVHAIPTEGIDRWNTGINNQEVKADDLSLEDILRNIKEKKPDLSCSSVSFKKRYSPNDKQQDEDRDQVGPMYPFGIVLKQGKVLSTYRYDAGTLTEKDTQHKKSKYDAETKDTSIQENAGEKVDNVLKRKFDRYLNPESGFYDRYIDHESGVVKEEKPEGKEGYRGDMSGRDFDEFVIEKPEIDGLFVDMDNPALQESWDTYKFDYVNELVHKYPGVPVYIKKGGEVTIYEYGEDGTIKTISDEKSFEQLKSLEDIIK